MQDGERDGSRLLDVIRDDGDVLLDGEEALLEVIERVQANGGKGSVTVTLTVERPKNANPRDVSLTITGSINSRSPKKVSESHRWYVQDDGSLTKYDPRQPQMPGFASVNRTTGVVDDDRADEAGEA